MSIVGWVLFGLIAGLVVGKFFLTRNDHGGLSAIVFYGVFIGIAAGSFIRTIGISNEEYPGTLTIMAAVFAFLCFIVALRGSRGAAPVGGKHPENPATVPRSP